MDGADRVKWERIAHIDDNALASTRRRGDKQGYSCSEYPVGVYGEGHIGCADGACNHDEGGGD